MATIPSPDLHPTTAIGQVWAYGPLQWTPPNAVYIHYLYAITNRGPYETMYKKTPIKG